MCCQVCSKICFQIRFQCCKSIQIPSLYYSSLNRFIVNYSTQALTDSAEKPTAANSSTELCTVPGTNRDTECDSASFHSGLISNFHKELKCLRHIPLLLSSNWPGKVHIQCLKSLEHHPVEGLCHSCPN